MPKRKDEKLTPYEAKRDLSRSGEPLPKKAGRPRLRFVIQKHAARRLHFDLRLEAGGVLKSWAVPKGPSTDPRRKVLAIMVEDHPVSYADFEGTITEGNYGAGSVIIWDRGTYEIPGLTKKQAEERILFGIEKGDLIFFLKGRKLRGGYTLARMKDGGNNWLLMKRDDEFANQPVTDQRSVKSERIVTAEDTAKWPEIEQAPKARLPETVKPMLARLVEKSFRKEGWIFELKLDGYRALAFIGPGTPKIRSRNNQILNAKFPGLLKSLKRISKQMLLDGEIVVLDRKGRPDFQRLKDYLETGLGYPVYYAFDILHYDGRDVSKLPLLDRKDLLKRVLPILPDIRYVDHIETEGLSLLKSIEELGIEGLIAKRGDSPYEEGKRSDDWLKVKITRQQEAVIGGYTAPQGSRQHFGALMLGIYENSNLVYAGHCGTGFDKTDLLSLKKRMDSLKTEKSPFATEPPANALPTWIKPELVCEVKFANWTKEGLMRHPVFVGLRDDRNPMEVTREIPEKAERLFSRQEDPGLRISHPEKVFWPGDGYTKKDMADYYERISDIILPYLKDRPESLHRFPNGIAEKSFYQKNLPETPSGISTASIYSDSEKKTINYLLCQDKTALLYMANLGCIEIHPWNSRIGQLDNPDYLILDIDPEGVPFSAVIKVALATREVLRQAGLDAYVKTSGATGLHVCVALGAEYSYDQTREFSHLINLLVNRRLPGITSLARPPKERRNRVYLDYLQNRRGQTLAAPYSLRPRPGAPVSTPLKWSEVRSGLKPASYNIKNILARLKKVGDLWEGVLGEGIDMLEAIEKLDGYYKKNL